MQTPKTVVYDTPAHALQRKSSTVENSTDFPIEVVAKHNAINYVSNFLHFTAIDTCRTMGHRFGYTRFSTSDQDTQLQLDAFTKVSCFRIFTDTASGSLEPRPELDKLLEQSRPGDTLAVWRLDRSIRHLVNHMDALQQQGIEFKSL